eukprot:403366954
MTVKFPQLLYEAKIMRLLQGNEGIPILFWAGQEGEFNVMVMELLGPSLEDLFSHCGQKLTLKSTLMLAKQMLSRIEYFHSRQFVHRDIKPDNFLMGMGNKSDTVYLIDYGLAKRYIDPKTGQHIPFKEGKALTGTARYTSLNNHLGYEQSRRDDLEGFAYVLIYLVRGQLPWMGIGGNTKTDKYQAIMQMKRDLQFRQISQELPIEFEDLLRYCRALKFTDRPDYSYLKKMFDAVFYRANFIDYQFDWKLTHKKNSLNIQKNLETQFLATEALARRKRFGDKYDIKFPPIKLDAGAIAQNLKNGILKKEYNYEDPDNDDDFSRGGRKKYKDGDDEEYGEEDYEDEDGEEGYEDDEDLEEDDHDNLYPRISKKHKPQSQQQRPRSQVQYNPVQTNKQPQKVKSVQKLPDIKRQTQQKPQTKKQQDDQEEEEYDEEEDGEEDGEYDDEDDEDNKTGLRSQQSRARDRLQQHLNNSHMNSVISNTVMRDLRDKIDKKAINPYANINPYNNAKQKPRSMRESTRNPNKNKSQAPPPRQRSGLDEEQEQRIKVKDLTNQINRGIKDMNNSLIDTLKKKKEPIRNATPIRLNPIMRNENMLPNQPPMREPSKQLPQPISLAKPQQKQQQQQLAIPKNPNNFLNKNNPGAPGKSTMKSGGKSTKRNATTGGVGDSLNLDDLNEDFEEELEEDFEEDDEDEYDEDYRRR